MAEEIERKFLVCNDSYRKIASKRYPIIQGYLSTSPEATVRVRVKADRGFITVKGLTRGCSRSEWEYEVPVGDAREMLALCRADCVLSKTRYMVGRWEVDEFHGRLEGLVVAEIELSGEHDEFSLPDFIGREVTGDARYYNSSLSEAQEIPD